MIQVYILYLHEAALQKRKRNIKQSSEMDGQEASDNLTKRNINNNEAHIQTTSDLLPKYISEI